MSIDINECILLLPFPLARRTIRVRLSSLSVEVVIVWPMPIVFSDFLAIIISGWPGLILSRVVVDRSAVTWLRLTLRVTVVTLVCNGNFICLVLIFPCGPKLARVQVALTTDV